MNTVKCQTIVNIIEELAPKKYAEDWDNVGLLVGEGNASVRKLMVSLDVPEWVVDEAIEKNVDMIIAHHPIIFKGIKRINNDSVLGRKLIKLIRNNISVYCAHTNYDIAQSGLNDALALHLGFDDFETIDITTREKLYKVCVFVPSGYEKQVIEAMSRADAGHIGGYSSCSFRAQGIGTFKPLEGTNPFIGDLNKLESVEEFRVETITTEANLKKVINAMLKVHPYEEAAYDVYELKNIGKGYGIGKLAKLRAEADLLTLAEVVKRALNIQTVRIAGDKNKKITKAAILNGSGNSFINSAYYAGAQVLITGDMQYHEISDAVEMGLCVIDAGHFATEKIMINLISNYLKDKFHQSKYDIEIIESLTNTDPLETI